MSGLRITRLIYILLFHIYVFIFVILNASLTTRTFFARANSEVRDADPFLYHVPPGETFVLHG